MKRFLVTVVALLFTVPAMAQTVPSGTPSAGAPAAALSATLVVESTPRDGLVYVDGTQAGRTPATVAVAAGLHRVRVLLTGFDVYEETVTVAEGGTARVAAALVRPRGTVSVEGLPPGATLTVNEVPADGPTSVFYGDTRIAVTLASGRTVRAVVPVAPGEETRVVYGDHAGTPRRDLLSLVVPGAPQLRGGRRTPGLMLALGAGTGLGVALAADVTSRVAQGRVDDALAAYGATQVEAEAVAAYADAADAADLRDGARAVRTGAFTATAVVALASVVDAVVHHVRGPGFRVSSPTRPSVGMQPTLGPAGTGVRFAVTF